jgi:hypothetical protein
MVAHDDADDRDAVIDRLLTRRCAAEEEQETNRRAMGLAHLADEYGEDDDEKRIIIIVCLCCWEKMPKVAADSRQAKDEGAKRRSIETGDGTF